MRPLPEIDEDTVLMWEGCLERKLRLQRCSQCGTWRYYPAFLCPSCGADTFSWEPVSGGGVVHAFTVVREAPTAAFATLVPYVYALVELAEGPIMGTNIVDADLSKLAIGMAVELTFEQAAPDVALPVFKPVPERLSEK